MKKKSYVDERIKKSYTIGQLERYLKNQTKRKAPKEKIEEIKKLIEQNKADTLIFVDGLMKSPLVTLATKQLIREHQIIVKKLGRFKIGCISTKREGALLLYTMIRILQLAERKKQFEDVRNYVSQKDALYIYSELPKGLADEK